jgi:hypothetical protein
MKVNIDMTRPRLTLLLFLILGVIYLMAASPHGLLSGSALSVFAKNIGPAIGVYIFAEIVSRKIWGSVKGGESGNGQMKL